MNRAALALVTAVAVSACSLSVSKPPATYRTGIVPDCQSSYLPPVIDYAMAAASLGTIALDDKVFCVTCPVPYLAAAVFIATGVLGHRRVRGCKAVEEEHDAFLALPRDDQDRLIRERQSREKN